LLPIVARAPADERTQLDSWPTVPLWSSAAMRMIQLGQVVNDMPTESEGAYIWRRDRLKTITVHADPVSELASDVMARVKAPIEQALNVDVAYILDRKVGPDEDPFEGHASKTVPVRFKDKLPLKDMPGYFMAWGGQEEDAARGNKAVSDMVPPYGTLMVLIVIVLFNSLRKPLIIFLTVPLALIGVTAGLLLLGVPFSFVALGGLLSLSGMLIKNAIVLIDSIDAEIAAGKPGIQAITDAGVSRVIPVSMAALTTIMGMMPLLWDVLFKGMAVTIMFGLAFATVLTLIFVPLLYAIFFRIRDEGTTGEAKTRS
jgi:multidrug efflux pump subunit AcrB